MHKPTSVGHDAALSPGSASDAGPRFERLSQEVNASCLRASAPVDTSSREATPQRRAACRLAIGAVGRPNTSLRAPRIDVKKRRIGGRAYPVPMEVPRERRGSAAVRSLNDDPRRAAADKAFFHFGW